MMPNDKLASGSKKRVQPRMGKRLLLFTWKVFEFLYGLLTLALFLAKAYTGKRSFRKLSRKDKEQLATARDRLWNLNNHPFGLTHAFFELKDGKKLHYVFSIPENVVSGKTGLVFFLHGFPDSWYLWHSFLKKGHLKDDAVLIAVDLPGFGGSDSFPLHDAQTMLESIAEFMMRMREKYLPVDESDKIVRGPVVVAGHDWGAMIGFRLAAEAPSLADRFILSNSIHPSLASANVQERIASVSLMLTTWTHKPSNFGPLRGVFKNAKPLLHQLRKSAYVFAFKLPYPLAALLGRAGDFWMLRFLNAVSGKPSPSEPIQGTAGFELLASSIGPGPIELQQSAKREKGAISLQYPDSVRSRVSSGGWMEKLRVYDEGLAFGTWEKSLETLWELNQIEQSVSTGRHRSGSTVGIFDIGPPGTLRSPTTIIWGKNDVALDMSLALNGIGDYFGMHGSHVVQVSQCGHWVPLCKQGADAWEEIVHWAVMGEKENLKKRLEGYPLAKIVFEH